MKKKPNKTKTVTHQLTIGQQLFNFVKDLNPDSKYTQHKSGFEEVSVTPKNNHSEKIVVMIANNQTNLTAARISGGEPKPIMDVSLSKDTASSAVKLLKSELKRFC